MLATPELIAEVSLRQRLADVLPRYLAEITLYRASHAKLGLSAELGQMPLITKEDIRNGFPTNFLREPAELGRLLETQQVELEHTSGTSEARTALLLPSGWWAEQETRALRLNPISAALLDLAPAARRVTLNSPVCSGEICYTGVPSPQERTLGNTLFLSLSRQPFLWSEADLARMAEEAIGWRPQFLDLDPVYGVAFARYCERAGVRLPDLRFVLCSYEYLSVVHRRIFERAFGVPVFDLYGSTETGHLLMEAEDGTKRPSLETAVLEVLEPDELGIGDLVVTTLTNDFMPLVRYRIGDLVERLELPYHTRYQVHGRTADAFATVGGRRVTTRQIDQCFEPFAGLAHYQLIQRRETPWVLRYVSDGPGLEAKALTELNERLTALLELTGRLEMRPTELLLPEASGKFRLGYPLQAGSTS